MKIYKDDHLLEKYNRLHHLSQIMGEGYREHYAFHAYDAGELMCKGGEPVNYFYIFLKGKTKVYKTSDDGRILLLQFCHPMTNFGDMELINDTPYLSYVEAIDNCLLLAYPANYIQKVCLDRAAFLKYVCLDLSKKFDISSAKNTYNLLYPLKNRLAGYLVEYHMINPTNDVLTLSETYKEIAEYLGTSYRHLYRCLNQFKEMGIIHVDGKKVRILDVEALQELSKLV
ncbi:cyclic nucleotide-binding domain-containing protein [Vallitalea pronyensis]|uniref:Cyclic nucleotide-binding domain-containing protein n=1 Tax=Vallitalea pronyensis TaxID=1348613 RepID=A0A8J8MLL5_9FIRM|nr:cyclic nucleotide-binding domain-containing protein [Vallitalea pronyensis]QUI24005.1 cyclic nucleotide-binding domain-containing protein [Vallitalea pronyensis]